MVLEGLVQQVPFFSAIIQSPEIRSKSDLFAIRSLELAVQDWL
jgi:hypothetical protein